MIIVEVGSLNMDLVIRLPNLPRPGETLMGGVFRTYPGGKGANQAVAAARLGAQVHMVGCVGNDLFAKELIKNLESEGIDTSHVIVHPEESTGVAVIQVDEQGRNSIGLAGGANLRLTPENVTHALCSIGEFDALVMPLEVPIDVVVTAARIASEKGALVILNPAPAQHLPGTAAEVEHALSRFQPQRCTERGELFRRERIVDAVSALSDVEYAWDVHFGESPCEDE